MSFRVQKAGSYQYLQIVHSVRQGEKVRQQIFGTGKNAVFNRSLLQARRYNFEVERAIYLTVLHRLFTSGGDRAAER